MKTEKSKINYLGILELFCDRKELRDYLKQPFVQNGSYCSTDAHSCITIPIEVGVLDLKPKEKPNIQNVTPKEFHEPIEIDVTDFESKLLKNAILTDEFFDVIKECNNCDGEGELECDLGHTHDCPNCDGKGKIGGKKPTGKQIPDEYTIFKINDSGIMLLQLNRLIKAAKMLGENKIYLISSGERKPFYFKVGDAKVLIMNCMLNNTEMEVDFPIESIFQK